jgi:hypothetical protein
MYDFVNVCVSDGFDLSLIVIFVLLSFSRKACQVGSRRVCDDATAYFFVLPLLCFRWECCSLHRFKSYGCTHSVSTENNIQH